MLTNVHQLMSSSTLAVVYNDGSHWWADILCSRQFRRRQAAACYRYDGLEASGVLRHTGPTLTLSSDTRHLSLILYRRVGSPTAFDTTCAE